MQFSAVLNMFIVKTQLFTNDLKRKEIFSKNVLFNAINLETGISESYKQIYHVTNSQWSCDLQPMVLQNSLHAFYTHSSVIH